MDTNYLINYDAGWLGRQHKRAATATLILQNEAGEALAVKATYKNYWTPPGGIIDENETPKEAALRETREEVGIIVPIEAITFVAVINRRSQKAQTYQFVFTVKFTENMLTNITLDEKEIESYAFVSKQQVVAAGERYGQVLTMWAEGKSGYIESDPIV